MQSAGVMLFWVAVVLVMIPLSLWLLKRSGVAGPMGGVDAVLKAVSQVQLGQGQRVVTVEVNAGGERTWLVLGVTPQHITALHTLAAPDLPEPTAAAHGPATSFAQQLRRLSDRRPSE